MQLATYTRETPWMPTLGEVEAYILESNDVQDHKFDITFDWRQDYRKSIFHSPETLIMASYPMPDCQLMRRRLHMTQSGLSIWDQVLTVVTRHEKERPWVAYRSVIDEWLEYNSAVPKESTLRPLAKLSDAHF